MSPAAVARVARALRLERMARAYVFELAGKRDPDQSKVEPEVITSAITVGLKTISSPAYILDRAWNARAGNSRAERLFVGWLDQSATAICCDSSLHSRARGR